jgi:hypothetical protein
MIGYVLTHGLMKPNQSFIDSSKDDLFYVMARNEKT